MSSKEQTIKKIEELERELRNLKLDLTKQVKEKEERTTVKVNDRVRILNPKKGQGDRGVIVKGNPKTGYVSILTSKGNRIVRKVKNIVLIEE